MIYGSVLLKAPTLSYDDEDLIYPLKNISRLSQYIEKVKNGDILDRQPIRDLSYWLELKVEEVSGYRNSQLLNLALMFGCLLVFYSLLKTAKSLFPNLNEKFIYPILVLTAIHPVTVPSVAWAASRKHLLSGLFIMLATYFLFKLTSDLNSKKSKMYGMSIILFYALSLFSQPINLLWMGFAGIFLVLTADAISTTEKFRKVFREHFFWILPCLLLAILVASINWTYYNSEIFMATQGEGSNKVLEESALNLLKRLHILGRYFLQLVFPAWASPAPYELFDFRSLAGVFLFLAAVIWWFKTQFRNHLIWIGFCFAIAPILMMTIRLTNHGGWDTYLFTSVFGFMFIVYALLSQFVGAERPSRFFNSFRLMRILFSLIVVFFFYKSWTQVQIWDDEDQLWAYSNELEQTVYVKGALAKRKMGTEGVTPQVVQLVEEIQRLNPHTKMLGYLLGRVYFSAPISFEKKLELFASSEVKSPWMTYYLAITYAQNEKFDIALKILDEKYADDPKKFVSAFIGSWKSLADNWIKICEKALAPNCLEKREKINKFLTPKNQL